MSTNHEVGICILNWNAGPMLKQCVEHVDRATQGSAELIVVDNHSSDNSVADLKCSFPGVSILQNQANFGYAKGNNLGARYLLEHGCTRLLFLNPDVVLQADSFVALLHALDRSPTAGCAGGLSFNDEGVSRMSARSKPTSIEKIVLYGPLNRLPGFRRFRARHFISPQTLQDGSAVYAVTGACLLFKAKAFDDAGGFDENTFLYEEEFTMAERLLRSGWSTILAKSCRYFHAEAHSTDQMPYQRRLHFVQSEQYLLRAYYGWSAIARCSLKAYRLLEWCIYALKWTATHRRSKPVEPTTPEPSPAPLAMEAAASVGPKKWRQ